MSVFKENYSRDFIRKIQRALNEICYNTTNFKALVTDGIFGNLSITMLKTAQHILNEPQTGVFEGNVSQQVLKLIQNKYIDEQQLRELSTEYGIEFPMTMAIFEVESKGAGFLPSGRPIILFERHIFYRQVRDFAGINRANELMKLRPDIINTATGGYKGGEAEWDRLRDARNLYNIQALRSASWGLGQVMGFHAERIGFRDVTFMVNSAAVSERQQAGMMLQFCKTDPALLHAIRIKDFPGIAKIYNGSNYAINKYDEKLRDSYKKYA
ncbi:MAG: N-acetylmuramidase family protein [Gammaproteobacteria bacterium]|nr:N-acetylmuramidase family protein [Acholeplasmataceae bacterium]MCK9529135.1 N-acetylmuramidase family protein [Gammaproteobacteria bacterium]